MTTSCCPAAAVTRRLFSATAPLQRCFYPLPIAAVRALATLIGMFTTFFFPGIVLTLLTSGSISNLRPDRVLAVIHRDRTSYIRMVVIFFSALVCGAWPLVCIVAQAMEMGECR